jgi:hypothetical protein
MDTALLAPGTRRAYVLAGNAKITVVSLKTGTRFTFQIVERDPEESDEDGKILHFVKVLTGPDNTSNFTFLGTVFQTVDYRPGRRSEVPPHAPSARAWAWTWAHLESDQIEVWHSGRCGRCGRELTDPESIATGLGPYCREK